MFFSFMLDSTAGGRNNARPHSFLQMHNSLRLKKATQSLWQTVNHLSWLVIDLLHLEVVHWSTDKAHWELLANQQRYISWHCSRTVLVRSLLFYWIPAFWTSGIFYSWNKLLETTQLLCRLETCVWLQQAWFSMKSNLLTLYTSGKLSGTAWYWWLEYTFAGQPDEGPCHISALTQIAPIPHHYSSGERDRG